jgi:hypothetical protein
MRLMAGQKIYGSQEGMRGQEEMGDEYDKWRKEHSPHLIVHPPLAAPHVHPYIHLPQFLEPFVDH